jgi:hypothetical protein
MQAWLESTLPSPSLDNQFINKEVHVRYTLDELKNYARSGYCVALYSSPAEGEEVVYFGIVDSPSPTVYMPPQPLLWIRALPSGSGDQLSGRVDAKTAFPAIRAGLSIEKPCINDARRTALGAALLRAQLFPPELTSTSQAQIVGIVARTLVAFLVRVVRITLFSMLVEIVRIALIPCGNRTLAVAAYKPETLCHTAIPAHVQAHHMSRARMPAHRSVKFGSSNGSGR